MNKRAELKGKVAIVTGASTGIGRMVAERLVYAGAKVALVARSKDTLAQVAGELGADRAAAFPMDVGDLRALRALPARTVERFGRLDILVNNAGVNHRGPVAERKPDELEQIINVNLTAPIVLTRAAVDVIQRGGSIVNVASIAGMVPVPHEATYSASKAGLRAFTRASAEELEHKGIHVGCVCPGPVDTGFFGADIAEVPDLVFSQRISSAAEVAEAVLACIETHAPEIAVPRASGHLATLAYVFPKVAKVVRPLLEKKGARAKRVYAQRRARGT
jgi:short-subunit dehydrogenase